MWQRTLAICEHISAVGLARPTLYSASTIGRYGASLIRSTAVSTSSGQRWTPKEDQMLAEMYAKGVALKDMVAMFPSRTFPAVTSRRDRLNLTKFKRQAPYSQAEDETLMRLRSEGKSWTTISSAFPQRTRSALESRICRLQKRDVSPEIRAAESARCKWTEEEEQKLRDFVSQGLFWPKIVKLMPLRSLKSMESATRRLGLPMTHRSERWTADEDEKVIKGCEAGVTFADICATKLPDRTIKAIAN